MGDVATRAARCTGAGCMLKQQDPVELLGKLD
jgi:hypothetical protein